MKSVIDSYIEEENLKNEPKLRLATANRKPVSKQSQLLLLQSAGSRIQLGSATDGDNSSLQQSASPARMDNTNESVDQEAEEDRKPGRFVLTKPCSVVFKDESQKYRLPDKYVRNRLNSKHLGFINYNEIYQSAKKNLTY